MRRYPMVAASAAVILTACVYHIDSMVPPGSEGPVTLAGTWTSGSERAVVNRVDQSEYRIEYTDGDESLSLMARWGTLEAHSVLELRPGDGLTDVDWPVARLILIVELAGDTARTRALETDSVRAAVARGDLALPYLVIDEDLILTAPGAAMLKALAAFTSRPGVLTEQQVWHRQAN